MRRNQYAPFIVSGEYAKIEVLGTQFEVNENNNGSVTEVHVLSGKVLFSSKIIRMVLYLPGICRLLCLLGRMFH